MLFPTSIIDERKKRAGQALNQVIQNNEVVLVHAGGPIQRPGGHDQTYPFLPHPDYFWLTGIRRPEGVSAYSKAHGWIDFVEPISRDEKIWEGGGVAPIGKDLSHLESWLKENNFQRTIHLGQHPQSLSVNPSLDKGDVLESYNNERRIKDQAEIDLVRNIALMASKGYDKLKSFIRPGVTERQIQIAYETEVLLAGSEKFPYDTIVGTGTNAAILHAIPTNRVVEQGEMVLIDAGADIQDYCVDITRVFPASGKFSDKQQAIFDAVLRAQTKSIELMRPGVEWSEVHLTAAREMASSLRDLNILKCSVEESIATEAISVFFPHGVGHMVGLRVRDVGGKYNPHPKKYAGARLRVDLPLREGYLMTVEPGLYFIEALLKDEETRQRFKDQINWSEIPHWLNVGGVRLEDDIHVTGNGPENLTKFIPKN